MAQVPQTFEQKYLLRACRWFRFVVPQNVHGKNETSNELPSEKRTSNRTEQCRNMWRNQIGTLLDKLLTMHSAVISSHYDNCSCHSAATSFSTPKRPERLWSPNTLLFSGCRELFLRANPVATWKWLLTSVRLRMSGKYPPPRTCHHAVQTDFAFL